MEHDDHSDPWSHHHHVNSETQNWMDSSSNRTSSSISNPVSSLPHSATSNSSIEFSNQFPFSNHSQIESTLQNSTLSQHFSNPASIPDWSFNSHHKQPHSSSNPYNKLQWNDTNNTELWSSSSSPSSHQPPSYAQPFQQQQLASQFSHTKHHSTHSPSNDILPVVQQLFAQTSTSTLNNTAPSPPPSSPSSFPAHLPQTERYVGSNPSTSRFATFFETQQAQSSNQIQQNKSTPATNILETLFASLNNNASLDFQNNMSGAATTMDSIPNNTRIESIHSMNQSAAMAVLQSYSNSASHRIQPNAKSREYTADSLESSLLKQPTQSNSNRLDFQHEEFPPLNQSNTKTIPQQQQQQQVQVQEEWVLPARAQARRDYGNGLVYLQRPPLIVQPAPTVLKNLLRCCMKMLDEIMPPEDDERRKKSLVHHLKKISRSEFPHSDIVMFGSSANSLCLKGGDIDVCLIVPDIDLVFVPRKNSSNQQPFGNEEKVDVDDGASGSVEKLLKSGRKVGSSGNNGGQQKVVRGGNEQQQQQEGENQPGPRLMSSKQVIKKMGRSLRRARMENVQELLRARVPIVKLLDPKSGFNVDICVNNKLARHNTRLIYKYMMMDRRARYLALLIKYWAKRRAINETYRGTLSSYAYVLLVIQFLQVYRILPPLQKMANDGKEFTCAEEIPLDCVDEWNVYFASSYMHRTGSLKKPDLADLVVQFFAYYAFEFDYESSVVSIRNGVPFPQSIKRWSFDDEEEQHDEEFHEEEDENGVEKSQQKVGVGGKKSTGKKGNKHVEMHFFAIEDPFELTHDLGRVLDETTLGVIREEFTRAYEICVATGDFEKVCEPYIEPKVRVTLDSSAEDTTQGVVDQNVLEEHTQSDHMDGLDERFSRLLS